MAIRFFLFFLILIATRSFAQVDPVGQFNKHIVENWKGEYIRISQYRVKGTPYLLGESFPGTLTYKGGLKSDTKILYDLYHQKVGADFKNSILETDQILEEFSISLPEKFGGKTLLFRSAEVYGNTSLKSYLNVLEDGSKVPLLKLFKVKLVSDPSNMFDKELKIFEQYYEYYLYNKSTKELSKIKLKEKDLIKQLGDEEFLKEFIAKSDLDVSKEVDAIKLVNGYNNK